MSFFSKIWPFRNTIIGFLVILWVSLVIESSNFYPASEITSNDEMEETSDKEKDTQPIVKLYEAIQTSIQINIEFGSFLLGKFDLDTNVDDEFPSASQFTTRPTKHVKILLRKIISANAP